MISKYQTEYVDKDIKRVHYKNGLFYSNHAKITTSRGEYRLGRWESGGTRNCRIFEGSGINNGINRFAERRQKIEEEAYYLNNHSTFDMQKKKFYTR